MAEGGPGAVEVAEAQHAAALARRPLLQFPQRFDDGAELHGPVGPPGGALVGERTVGRRPVPERDALTDELARTGLLRRLDEIAGAPGAQKVGRREAPVEPAAVDPLRDRGEQVDHRLRLRLGDRAGQPLGVEGVGADVPHADARGTRAFRAAGKGDHLVTLLGQQPDELPADHAGGTGDQNAHVSPSPRAFRLGKRSPHGGEATFRRLRSHPPEQQSGASWALLPVEQPRPTAFSDVSPFRAVLQGIVQRVSSGPVTPRPRTARSWRSCSTWRCPDGNATCSGDGSCPGCGRRARCRTRPRAVCTAGRAPRPACQASSAQATGSGPKGFCWTASPRACGRHSPTAVPPARPGVRLPANVRDPHHRGLSVQEPGNAQPHSTKGQL